MPIKYDHDHDTEINYFGLTNFRNKMVKFGIKTDDRRRHLYIIGKTGMGKTTMIENMLVNDINAGHGVGIVDPHGDMADKILDFIPANRINNVVVFNPSDWEYPVAFNVLEAVNPLHKHLVAQGLMGVFKKIWPDVWSARMEHIMNNCLLALLDFPGSTLLGINRLLVDKAFRKRVISKIRDPIVRAFWVDEFQVWEAKFRTEAIQPIQNKVGQFLSSSMIRNIVAQVKSTINPREIMDTGKVFIMNLAKGKLGEDTSRLLGGMLITKMQLAAMERVDIPEPERRDFYLYVDEFQNFATDSFANILSEARKYRLNLTIAHQYIGQLVSETSTRVRDAVFGNVGTIIMFRIGADDAEFLARETEPHFMAEDLVNLPKYQVYLRLMIDGVTSIPFSATTMQPIAQFQGNREKIVKVSREKHARPVDEIESEVMRWAESTEDMPERGVAEVPVVSSGAAGTSTAPVRTPRIVSSDADHVREPERRAPASATIRVSPPAPIAATIPAVTVTEDTKPISLQQAMQKKPMLIKLSTAKNIAGARPTGERSDRPQGAGQLSVPPRPPQRPSQGSPAQGQQGQPHGQRSQNQGPPSLDLGPIPAGPRPQNQAPPRLAPQQPGAPPKPAPPALPPKASQSAVPPDEPLPPGVPLQKVHIPKGPR